MVLCMLERWSRAQGGALARSQNQLIKQLRSTVGTRSLEPWQKTKQGIMYSMLKGTNKTCISFGYYQR